MNRLLAVLLISAVTVMTVAAEIESSGDETTRGYITDDEDFAEESGSGGDFNPDDLAPTRVTTTEEDVKEKPVESKSVPDSAMVPEEEFESTFNKKVEIDVKEDIFVEEVVEIVEPVNTDNKNMGTKEEEKFDVPAQEEVLLSSSSVFDSAHFVTAVVIGGCVGLLFAVALIMLLLYRMRMKDEGSYALDDHKQAPPAYQYTQGQEYYA